MSRTIRALLPLACVWAKRQESIILKTGMPISPSQAVTAKQMGIAHPERVRLLAVRQVPPLIWPLRWLGKRLGVVSGQTIGMTLRYGIFIREDHFGDLRLLIHELAHVAQYERLGGFCAFLNQYLSECINPGYPFGQLEQEAKQAESAGDLSKR
jgi:hypothetical protein